MSESERIAARRESQLHGRVLLVDSEAVLNFEREILTAAGLDVVAVSSGSRALELLEMENFDVVLLDCDIPGEKSSNDLVDWLKNSQPDMAPRIILMVQSENHFPLRTFVNPSQIICFVKPFEAPELLATVRRVLRPMATKAAMP
jgi:DNA-binding response OmpR family regulator